MQASSSASDIGAARGEITELLGDLAGGDPAAIDQLFAMVYDQLHREAQRRRAFGRGNDTLSTTALVHETYLKLAAAGNKRWQDRAHFFAVAARAMRQILVDHARRRAAQKRGKGAPITAIDENRLGVDSKAEELLALDSALSRLGSFDPRLAHLVELRFFAGLSVEETAEALHLSERTIKRDWRKARAFLYEILRSSEQPSFLPADA